MTSEQEIFSEAFKMIREAEDIIIGNVFLFHDYTDQDRNFPDLNVLMPFMTRQSVESK